MSRTTSTGGIIRTSIPDGWSLVSVAKELIVIGTRSSTLLRRLRIGSSCETIQYKRVGVEGIVT